MKTTIIIPAFFALLFAGAANAQDRTTVNAKSSEISDNLDLRAVATLFGDAKNLEDFENRLNDPKMQISNLDLNEDNQVDYLRVIESVENNTHLIVIQSVLGKDTFQDVATIEVERDHNNNVQVQVVGDVYMYGQNYIYEPVYVATPVIYSSFWVPAYRPYFSVWYWDYYPSYYYAWHPCPVFRYRNNVNVYINYNNHYNYVTTRRFPRAVAMHNTMRANYIERTYPTKAFAVRNNNISNRYELDQTRKTVTPRYDVAGNTRNADSNNAPIKNSITRTENNANTRSTSQPNTRSDENTRITRSENTPIKNTTRTESDANTRSTSQPNTRSDQNTRITRSENTPVKNSIPRTDNATRSNNGYNSQTMPNTRTEQPGSRAETSRSNGNMNNSAQRNETRSAQPRENNASSRSGDRGNRR